MSDNYNSNQLDRLVNEIEGRLNDFDAGITDKDETIKSFAELIIKCAETAVNSIPMQAGVIVPKPNTTCEKNVCCANCKHFIDFDIEKDLQSACINDEIRDVTYVDKPDVFGCTFFEQREA